MMKLCAECGERAVAPRAVAGRTSPWKQFASLPIPAELQVPTCSKCGAEWINGKTAGALDAALEQAAAERLTKLAREALGVLGGCVSQRELEAELGLSAGYLSKVKHGKETPSAQLVGLLALLASRPARLDQLTHVWETGELPPRVTNDHFTTVEVGTDEAAPAILAL
jgi:hypothetical protein